MSRVVGQVYAVDGVSFEIRRGETLCLVGESGCGKSTVAKTVMRLTEPTAGRIKLNGTELPSLQESEVRPHRRDRQNRSEERWVGKESVRRCTYRGWPDH